VQSTDVYILDIVPHTPILGVSKGNICSFRDTLDLGSDSVELVKLSLNAMMLFLLVKALHEAVYFRFQLEMTGLWRGRKLASEFSGFSDLEGRWLSRDVIF